MKSNIYIKVFCRIIIIIVILLIISCDKSESEATSGYITYNGVKSDLIKGLVSDYYGYDNYYEKYENTILLFSEGFNLKRNTETDHYEGSGAGYIIWIDILSKASKVIAQGDFTDDPG